MGKGKNGNVIGNLTREQFDTIYIAAENHLKTLDETTAEYKALDGALAIASTWMNGLVDDEGNEIG